MSYSSARGGGLDFPGYPEDDDGEIDVEGCDDDYDDEDEDDFDCGGSGGGLDGLGGSAGGGLHGGGGSSSLDLERSRHVSGESGSSGGGDPSEESKRDHHNQLERKRRASIKNSFNSLREVIPEIKGSKASRAVILQKAVEYIDNLKTRNKAHSRCVDTLRRQNDNLEREVDAMDDALHSFPRQNGGGGGGNGHSNGGGGASGGGAEGGSGGSSPGAEGAEGGLRPASSKRMRLQ